MITWYFMFEFSENTSAILLIRSLQSLTCKMDHNYIPFMGSMSVYTPIFFIIFMYFILFAIYYLYSCALFSKRLPIFIFLLRTSSHTCWLHCVTQLTFCFCDCDCGFKWKWINCRDGLKWDYINVWNLIFIILLLFLFCILYIT